MKLLFAAMPLLQAKLQFDSTLKLYCPQHCKFHRRFAGFGGEIVEITRHARSGWQPCCSAVCFGGLWRSDLITPVRRVTPLHSFHMEKTHPTEAGYPDRLTGLPALVGYPT